MYQARSLIGSDASGLSDPFARVIFGDQSLCTQVIDETLSPTWDEMLIFNEVSIYGTIEEVKENPPTIVVEIFDQDGVVSFSSHVEVYCKSFICYRYIDLVRNKINIVLILLFSGHRNMLQTLYMTGISDSPLSK